jgi:hypothetical protein
MASLRLLAAWAYISTKPRHSGQGIFRVLPDRNGMGVGVNADSDIEASFFLARRNLTVSLSRSDARAGVRQILFDRERSVL